MDAIQLSVRIPEIKFHIQEAVRNYQGDLDKMVAEGVEKTLKSFDFNTVVSREIEGALRDAIKTTITRALSRMIWEPEFTEKVQEVMRETLKHTS